MISTQQHNKYLFPQSTALVDQLARCLEARRKHIDWEAIQALRLFNGFYEGLPGLTADLFGHTLVLSNHQRQPEELRPALHTAADYYLKSVPEVQTILVKERYAAGMEARQGIMLSGSQLQDITSENGVHYALDLRLNQDCSFYLDTRQLRSWLYANCADQTLLNCFAYSGALGVAALAGGARSVLQTDSNPAYLRLAERSAGLNPHRGSHTLLPMDYFKAISQLKRQGRLFDCLILDAPLFSDSPTGRIDLLHSWTGLINKARPLVAHGGRLVVVNNALFLSGAAVAAEINALEQTGYIRLEATVPVPQDLSGWPETRQADPPTDPSPYNHPTKISILHVERKDRALAN